MTCSCGRWRIAMAHAQSELFFRAPMGMGPLDLHGSKSSGGLTIAQDPDEASMRECPEQRIATGIGSQMKSSIIFSQSSWRPLVC